MLFISEFQKLYWGTPQDQNWTRQSENCDFGDIIVVSKNCFMCFNSGNLENCFYSYSSQKCYDCNGLMFCVDCNICYECLDSALCYNCDFIQWCEGSTDCKYCYDCKSCKNCFGCVGLIHKEFHIFNVPYTKEEYETKIHDIKYWPEEKILEEFEKLKLAHPVCYMHRNRAENCYGDYIINSKNCYNCFDIINCEDSFYITEALLEKGPVDCCDCGPIANTLVMCYDTCFSGYLNNCNHIYWADYLADCEWCSNIWDSKHCFGCVYTKNREYCILNEKYSPKEYEEKVKECKKELLDAGILDLFGLINYGKA